MQTLYNKTNITKKIRSICLGYLSKYNSTEYKFRIYLENKLKNNYSNFSQQEHKDIIHNEINYMKSMGYIDDTKYCKIYTKNLIHAGYSLINIKAKLQLKGVSYQTIVNVIEDIPVNKQEIEKYSAIQYAIKHNIKPFSTKDTSDVNTIYDKMQRKGFSTSTISFILSSSKQELIDIADDIQSLIDQ